MLTEVQKDRLIARAEKKNNELEAYKKRHNDQVVLDKFADYVESAPDMLLILKHMPHEKIAEKLKPEYIPAILELVEAILARIDSWAVIQDGEKSKIAIKTVGVTDSDDPQKRCRLYTLYRLARPEEIALCNKLSEHCQNLRHYFDPKVADPISRNPNELGNLGDLMREEIRIYPYISNEAAHLGKCELVNEEELRFKVLDLERLVPTLIPRQFEQESSDNTTEYNKQEFYKKHKLPTENPIIQ